MAKAEQLAEAWHKTGLPILIGGAAFNQPSGDFVPGRYLKEGYVITSRGCNNILISHQNSNIKHHQNNQSLLTLF